MLDWQFKYFVFVVKFVTEGRNDLSSSSNIFFSIFEDLFSVIGLQIKSK